MGEEVYASMDDPIVVGFGEAVVLRDGETVLDGGKEDLTFQDAENEALLNPDSLWEVLLLGSLWSQRFRREGAGKWRMVEAGLGFA